MKRIKIFSYPLIAMGLVLGLLSNCKKDEPVILIPTLTTTAISELTDTSAVSGGMITSDGGAAITASGVCWSIVIDPRVEDSKTIDAAVDDAFISNITGLTSEKKYYVRAYATNSAGTGYGESVEFTTLKTPPKVYLDQEGNVIEYVKIGDQIWSKKNLNVHHYRDGSPIPVYRDNDKLADGSAAAVKWDKLTTGAMIEYVSGDSTYAPLYSVTYGYGGQYNWYAANDSRNLAPAGWHVATPGDWEELLAGLGYNTTVGADNSEIVSSLRDASSLWVEGGGTNTSGFSALPNCYSSYQSGGDYYGWIVPGVYNFFITSGVSFSMWLKADNGDPVMKDWAYLLHWNGVYSSGSQAPLYNSGPDGSYYSTRFDITGSGVRLVKDN
jgi:uncharacterized protein (TIGR02145 family)